MRSAVAATDASKSERKGRIDCILGRLEAGDELGVYDMIVMFRVSRTTVYRDMDELEAYHGVDRRTEATGKTGPGETVWYMPGADDE